MPAHAQATVKAEFWKIFDDTEADAEPGPAAVAVATSRARAFASKWRSLYPAAIDCLEDDFEHLVTYLRFPLEHWSRIRHSNFIERTFGETRRRVKVIGRLPGERSCLSLVWAVLDRAGRGWRGVNQTIPSVRLLAEIRRELFDPIPIVDETAIAGTECHTGCVTSHEEPASVGFYTRSGTQPCGRADGSGWTCWL